MARARRRDSNQSRHRLPPTDRSSAQEPDAELESYLAALSPAAAGSTDGSVPAGGFGTAQVFQLRLPSERVEQLRALAEARGVAPASLVVDWIVERLDAQRPQAAPPPTAAELTDPFLGSRWHLGWGRDRRPG